MARAVAFIDLLGFKNLLINDDIQTVISLFENYNTVLTANVGYTAVGFESFLPMSDSIVLTAVDPNKLTPILSRFLIDCFLFTAGAYQNVRQGQNPTEVSVPIVSASGVTENTEKWPPTIFRGGCGYGEVVVTTQQAVEGSNPVKRTNIAGRAFLNAVQLEQRGLKGPRVLIDESFKTALGMDFRRYVLRSEIEDCDELLWPGFFFEPNVNPNIGLNSVHELFSPAAVLYGYFKHFSFRSHYLELLKLIVRSTLRFFEDRDELDAAKRKLADLARSHSLERELGDLITGWPEEQNRLRIVWGRVALWFSRLTERLRDSIKEFPHILQK